MKIGNYLEFLSGLESWWFRLIRRVFAQNERIWQKNVAVCLAKRFIVKVNDYWGYEISHIDVMQRRSMGTSTWAA